MSKGLKSCPFCGNKSPYSSYDSELNVFSIRCEKCDARGGYRKTVDEAVAAWNGRSEMTVSEYEKLQWLDKPMWPSWDT